MGATNIELIEFFNTSRKKRAVKSFSSGYDLVDDCTTETDYTYIDMHSYKTINYICIDYDHQSLNNLFDLSHYPEPNIIVQSKTSSKYHLVYLLNRPVYLNGNPEPLQKLHEIRKNLTHLLDGDKSYNNIYMYNLFNSDKYDANINNSTKYNFDDFYEYFDVEDFKPSQRKSTSVYEYDINEYDIFPIGMRNTLLFQEMRRYAYNNYIPSHNKGFDLLDRVASYGFELNEEFCEIPFKQGVVLSIAKSIISFIKRTFSHKAYHTWISKHYSSERQAFRGRRKNLSKRLKGEIYIMDCLLQSEKPIAKIISDTFDCSLRTAYKWISRCKLIKREYHIDKLREDDDYERNFMLNHIDAYINPIKLQTFKYTETPQHVIDSMGWRDYTAIAEYDEHDVTGMTKLERKWLNDGSKDFVYHEMSLAGRSATYQFEKGKDWIYIIQGGKNIIIVENHPMFDDPKYHTVEGTDISLGYYERVVNGKSYVKPFWKEKLELEKRWNEIDQANERIRINQLAMPELDLLMKASKVRDAEKEFLNGIL